jgi:hypothetical protein
MDHYQVGTYWLIINSYVLVIPAVKSSGQMPTYIDSKELIGFYTIILS